jgi:CRP-like cAMP-binding protein
LNNQNDAAGNSLLSQLPARDRKRFLAECTPIELEFENVLAQSGDPIAHVYFPTAGYLSLLRPIDGDQVEVALAGDEGMFGWPLAMGVGTSNVQALVQGAGRALSMGAKAFQRELKLSATLQALIGRYAYVLMTQFAQSVGCNRFHVVEQRMARWLLMTADRAHSDSFRITHEFLANMLGVRRAGVTTAARAMQARGLIRYKRGNLFILDRPGLEHVSCNCYQVNLDTYRGVLG